MVVITGRRETAVVRGPEAVQWNVLGRLQHTVTHLLGTFDLRVDRVDDADEDARVGPLVVSWKSPRAHASSMTERVDLACP
jgi:hypothetical protein